MLSRLTLAAAGLALLVPTLPAAAQTTNPVVMGTYYRCNTATEARADTVWQRSLGPIFDRMLAANQITAWGWLSHNTGGAWRRVSVMVAPDMDKAMDARDALIREAATRQAAALREFNTICSSHDDYIWVYQTGSTAPADVGRSRPPAGFSVYYQCDPTREQRADELVRTAIAPIYERHREAGHLNSWGWYSHSVGGFYRRLSTMDGPDHKSLMQARAMIIADLQREAPLAAREFNEICNAHTDYMWDLTITRP